MVSDELSYFYGWVDDIYELQYYFITYYAYVVL
jgi:hypothetical protein